MASHIFNVYFHTDMVELKSEYFFELPSFYFATNEYVTPKATIHIPNSIMMSRGANVFNAETIFQAGSMERCEAFKSTYFGGMVIMTMGAKALVEASSVKYSNGNSYVWLRTYVVPEFTHV